MERSEYKMSGGGLRVANELALTAAIRDTACTTGDI